MSIIKSLLDTDFYKFTMQQVVFKKFPDVEVEFLFKNRTKGKNITYDKYASKILREIYSMEDLVFRPVELNYLKSLRLFSKGYLEYLKTFRFNSENVRLSGNDDEKKDGIHIKIKGTWLNTILWEVPLLAIISELVSTEDNKLKTTYWTRAGVRLLDKKIKLIINDNENTIGIRDKIRFADFGTRRRYSHMWQNYVVKELSEKLPTNFVGTSNVYLAMKYKVKPIGTMAHEFIQAHQQLEGCRLEDSQKCAFQTWADVYRGNLGIALSDTLGKGVFFKDFDMYFAKLFDGARHDSGNPYKWCRDLIKMYMDYGIEPRTKTAVFSDGLDFLKMTELYNKFRNKIKCSFGIGTNLTNDCGIEPLQIVIKMTKCNGQPVAKISDSKGKQMCLDKEYLKHLAKTFNIPKERL